MTDTDLAIEIRDLRRKFGKTDAVNGLNLSVRAGRCFGLFGRNGAGKTTTIKCLLNHLRPTAGSVSVFGMNPRKNEVLVKSRIGYVPEQIAFYPWMSVRKTLEYAASFRPHWNRDLERELIARSELDEKKKTDALSKGMRAQLALICAICPEPDLLLLDEPTSGLDPIIRREFIETVIGAYQEGAPERRTIFVSTHLIAEFEGLIDEFAIMEAGKEEFVLESDAARARFKKIRLRFEHEPPEIPANGLRVTVRDGREIEVLSMEHTAEVEGRLRALNPESIRVENLTLEEIFVALGRRKGAER